MAAAGQTESRRFEAIVVGAGAAGLFSALCAARAGGSVALISATPLAETSSYWAQGGLAAAIAESDSTEQHLSDTLRAGRGAVRLSAAQTLVAEAPDRLDDLLRLGVRFDADRHGNLVLGLEGGHSKRRIVHGGGSATGRRLLRALSGLVVEQDRITVIEGSGARVAALLMDAGRCTGVQLSGGLELNAPGVILATGGYAALWSRTTNPPSAYGDGMLLAHAAGATLADLELMQFHPTAVRGLPGKEGYLITEAMRGEGATLHGADGERFVDELAPRDEVSRAIDLKMRQDGCESVQMDLRGIDPAHFPNVFSALREAGLDPSRELVPVAPAAHYSIGGARTDLHGRTDVPGLLAVGEVACTGLHGANRLASNSLSECFVFGARAATAALGEAPAAAPSRDPESRGSLTAARSETTGSAPTQSTRGRMWRCAGVLRDAELLAQLEGEKHPLARMIARAGIARGESRGVHQRSDLPGVDPGLDGMHLCLQADGSQSWQRWD